MKIFILTTLYPPNGVGGAEITAHMLARRFLAWGHEVVAVSLAPDGRPRTLTVDGVRCYYVPLANVYWPYASPRPPAARRGLWHAIDAFNPVMGARVGRILDRERPDVAHMHNLLGFSVAAWRAAQRRRVPVVQTLHDYYLVCPRSVMVRGGRNCDGCCLGCRAYRGPRLALSGLPRAVTAVSHRMLERITATGVFARVARRVVIRGLNDATGPAPGAEAPGAEPPSARDHGHGPLRVGYIGRLEPLKGVDVLLRANELLPGGAFTVSIAGTGAPDYVASLRAGTDRPNVRFLGFANPTEFLGDIDVLVVPSLWEEPAGRVIHEAYAHGVPVIASRLGGPQEMVVEGRTGYLVEPGSARALADTLDRVRMDGPGAMFQACLEESMRYDGEKIAGEYMTVLAAAVAGTPKPRALACGPVP